MKKLIATTALATAIAIPSFAAEIGTAVSATVGAGVDKVSEGYNTAKGAIEDKMATSNAESAKAEIKDGDVKNAATDAADAAKHSVKAADAKAKAKAHKASASHKMNKAKAAINADASADVSASAQ